MKTDTTIRERLTGFFILLVGTALLISLFTFLFSAVSSQKCRQSIEYMTVFHEYYETVGSFEQNCRYYVSFENEVYFLNAQTDIAHMEQLLNTLSAREHTPEISREILDLSDMTSYLKKLLPVFHSNMLSYLDAGETAFSQVRDQYDELQNVCAAIDKYYPQVNRRILDNTQVSYLRMQNRSQGFVVCFLLALAIACVILLVQIRHFSSSFSGPVYALTQKAEEIRRGTLQDVSPLLPAKGLDKEIRILTDVFNDMIIQLKRQMDTLVENARMRQELAESRFKELQMQINPHFLFNTLNMIAEKAYLEHAEETVTLLESAARMFRFSLDFSGRPVSLFREIEELGNYVFIQEQRFGDRIEFSFQLDESFHALEIPALSLQPLVENAIVHGVGSYTENARVLIRTTYDSSKRMGYIVIEDNGKGMSPEKLAEVQKNLQNYTGCGAKVGLGNVFLRLKLFFGEDLSMTIDSKEREGTRIVIGLPCGREVSHVPVDHS